MCVVLTFCHPHNLFLWLFVAALSVILTNGELTHIRIETKLSTLEDITIGVLVLVLCIVLSFAAYFVYLRIVINRAGSRSYNAVSNQSSNRNGLITVNDVKNASDTTSLLKRTTIIKPSFEFDESERMNSDDSFKATNRNTFKSSYVSFAVYGTVDDKEYLLS
eukprot:UN04042